MKTTEPDSDSRQPALAIGGLSTVAGLGVALVAQRLGVPPEVLGPLAAALAPIVTAVLIRTRVYAPATVARLLAARGDSEPPR